MQYNAYKMSCLYDTMVLLVHKMYVLENRLFASRIKQNEPRSLVSRTFLSTFLVWGLAFRISDSTTILGYMYPRRIHVWAAGFYFEGGTKIWTGSCNVLAPSHWLPTFSGNKPVWEMRALLPAVAEQLLKDIQKTFTETTRSEWSAVKNGCNVTVVSRQFYCRCSHGVEQQVDCQCQKLTVSSGFNRVAV